jgi:hypothetical protein
MAMGDTEYGRWALRGQPIIMQTTMASQHRRPSKTRCGRGQDPEVPTVTRTSTPSTTMGGEQEAAELERPKEVRKII